MGPFVNRVLALDGQAENSVTLMLQRIGKVGQVGGVISCTFTPTVSL